MKTKLNLKLFSLICLLFFSLVILMPVEVSARMSIVYDGESHLYTEDPFSFYVDGELLTDLPVEPVRINGRFYVPARAFFEQLGAEVSWYAESQQILIILNGNITLMGIDDTIYYVNDEIREVETGEEPKLVGYPDSDIATTMVPVRMVSEGLGFEVSYDGENKIIAIDSQSIDVPELEDTTEDNTEDTTEDTNTNETDDDNEESSIDTDNDSDNNTEDNTTENNNNVNDNVVDNILDPDGIYDLDDPNGDLNVVDSIDDTDDIDNTTDNSIDDIEDSSDNQLDDSMDSTQDNSDVFILPINKSQFPLTEEYFDVTTLSNFYYQEPTVENNFSEKIIINADSEISKVTELLLPDGRLVLDFDKTIFNIQDPMLEPTQTTPFIRTNGSQFANEPTKISRIVINLKSATHYTLAFSEDRTSLEVEFLTGQINDYGFNNNKFYINGTKSFSSISKINKSPFELIVDFPGMTLDSTVDNYYTGMIPVDYITNVTLIQNTPNSTRATFSLANDFLYNINQTDYGVEIEFNSIQNAPAYYSYMNDMFILNKSFMFNTLDINQITHYDDYLNKKYSFTLNTQLFNLDNELTSKVNSSDINYFKVKNNDDYTSTITLDLNKVRVFELYEDETKVYFMPKSPSEVYSRVVVVDPGHGGTDPGTTMNDLFEKDIVLDVGLQVEQFLNASGENIKVYMTRDTDILVGLYEIAKFTNEVDPDLFVSIHVNSAYPNRTAGGTETYYYNPASPEVADIIHKNLLNGTDLRDRKVKTAGFVVIRETELPAVLTEMAFISNPTEEALLRTAEFRTSVAQSLADGIVESFYYLENQ